MNKDTIKGDVFKIIQDNYSQCSIVISNILNRIKLDLIRHGLMQEFYRNKQTYIYLKLQTILKPLFRSFGKSFLMN